MLASFSCSSPFPLKATKPPKPKTRTRVRPQTHLCSAFSDPFVIQLAETLEDSLPSLSPLSLPLQKLRDISSQSLLSKTWPSSKDEPFRFTDTSFLKKSQIQPIISTQFSSPNLPIPPLFETHFPNLAIVDGRIVVSSLSDPASSSSLPQGVFVGSISDASESLTKRVFDVIAEFSSGDLFWDLNGIGAPDVAVVYVPAGCRVETPLHLGFFSVGGVGEDGSKKLPVSNPRALVLVEEGGEIGIVEEYLGGGDVDDKCYWTNSVMEIVIGEGAKVRHSYIQRQSANAAHIKWTFVQQVN